MARKNGSQPTRTAVQEELSKDMGEFRIRIAILHLVSENESSFEGGGCMFKIEGYIHLYSPLGDVTTCGPCNNLKFLS